MPQMARMTLLIFLSLAWAGLMSFVTLYTGAYPNDPFAQSISSLKLVQGINGLFAFYVLLTLPYGAMVGFISKFVHEIEN